jgi:CHAD domain-containing protein
MKHSRRIPWDKRGTAGENAGRQLPGLVTSYLGTVRKHLAKDPDPAELHSLRLATKRLRYTLELFRPCYGPGMDSRLAVLRKVQQRLGDLNDCVAARNLLEKIAPASPQRDRFTKLLEKQALAHAARFRAEWQRLFESPGRDRWWTSYLARPARGGPSK